MKKLWILTLTFKKKLVEYLESVHVGEFLTGSKEYAQSNVQASEKQDDYRDPTTTLPQHPPIQCDNHSNSECNTGCKAQ